MNISTSIVVREDENVYSVFGYSKDENVHLYRIMKIMLEMYVPIQFCLNHHIFIVPKKIRN
jgi:hypothetical protein